jgi:hypothetical protein
MSPLSAAHSSPARRRTVLQQTDMPEQPLLLFYSSTHAHGLLPTLAAVEFFHAGSAAHACSACVPLLPSFLIFFFVHDLKLAPPVPRIQSCQLSHHYIAEICEVQ